MFLDYGTMATNIVRWMKTKISGYKPIAGMRTKFRKTIVIFFTFSFNLKKRVSFILIKKHTNVINSPKASENPRSFSIQLIIISVLQDYICHSENSDAIFEILIREKDTCSLKN